MTGESKTCLERCLYLMTHPDIKIKDYCRRFEVSRVTYYRDKSFIQDRLWKYEVKEKI